MLGLAQTNDLVRLNPERRARLARAHRDGHDQPGGRVRPDGLHGGMHRRARGQPVVHQDHDPPPNPRRGPTGAEQRLAAPRLLLLDPRDGGGIGLGDAELADHIPVQEAPAVSRHRADRELGGLRRA